MLSPRSPSDWGQLSSEKEDEASQKMAVKAWKAEKSRMPSRISKQKAKVVAYHEGGVVATILHDQGHRHGGRSELVFAWDLLPLVIHTPVHEGGCLPSR